MSKFFIERPILANVIAIVTILLGAVCLLNLPVAQYPDIVPPTILVATNYPGASAEVVATTVGIPIEQGVNGVEGSIYMQSTSGSDGSYTLTVTFAVGTDLNAAIALVQNAVNGALSQLPKAVQIQGVSVQKVSTNILMIASLYSDDNRFDETFLSNYAIINLQNPLARLPGVGTGAGAGRRPLQHADLARSGKIEGLWPYRARCPERDLRTRTSRWRPDSWAARRCRATRCFQFTVKTLGRLSDVKQFENIIVKSAPPSTLASQAQQPPAARSTRPRRWCGSRTWPRSS